MCSNRIIPCLACHDRDVHSVCEALLRFLDSLPEPVIPFALQERCLRVSQSPVACWQVYCCAHFRFCFQLLAISRFDLLFVSRNSKQSLKVDYYCRGGIKRKSVDFWRYIEFSNYVNYLRTLFFSSNSSIYWSNINAENLSTFQDNIKVIAIDDSKTCVHFACYR